MPLGIDPGFGGAVFPANILNPVGPGIVSSLDPDTIETELPFDPGEVEVETPLPITAQWQVTRYVRFANSLDQRVTINLVYQTLDQNGELVEGNADVVVEPGERSDLFLENWRVNAMQVSFTATAADGTVLRRTQDGWVNLVPETDEQGVPGYASSLIQTSVISLR